MAYNRINILTRIVIIQEITFEQTQQGVSQEYVYRMHVAPRFCISRRTFYRYLAINAKKELSRLKGSASRATLSPRI